MESHPMASSQSSLLQIPKSCEKTGLVLVRSFRTGTGWELRTAILRHDDRDRPGHHLETRDRRLENHRVAVEMGGQGP